jgi:hypothetical protein
VHELAIADGDPAGRVVTRTSSGLEMRDFRSGRRLDTAITSERDGVWQHVSPDGGVVALVKGSQLVLWFTDLRAPRRFDLPARPSLAADGRWLAYAASGEVVARDLVTGAKHTAPIKATLVRASDDGSVAALTADRHVVVWRPGSAPRDLGAIAGKPVAVFALSGDRAAVSLDDRTLRVVTATGTSPICGDRRAVRLRGSLAVVRGLGACDLDTGAVRGLLGDGAITIAPPFVATPAGVFRDGNREPFPAVADATAFDLDARGSVLAAATPRGLAFARRGDRAVLALPGSAGATLAAASSTRIASVIDDRVVAWELGRPGAPHVLGTLASRVILDLVSPERDEVITIGATGTGFVADAWPAGVPSLAQVDAWLRLVR